VDSAAFSPDGSRIVTASWDKTARIWDAASAKEVAVLRGHENIVSSAAFSPDGSRIVTASEDETARIWDVHLQTMSVKDLLTEVCARLAGATKLTREEMRLAGYSDRCPRSTCAQAASNRGLPPWKRAARSKSVRPDEPRAPGGFGVATFRRLRAVSATEKLATIIDFIEFCTACHAGRGWRR